MSDLLAAAITVLVCLQFYLFADQKKCRALSMEAIGKAMAAMAVGKANSTILIKAEAVSRDDMIKLVGEATEHAMRERRDEQ